MFTVLSSCHIVIARVHPVHLMNADCASVGRQPSDQTNGFGLWVRRKIGCYHQQTKSPFITITQLVSWYSFYRPTKGGRLSRPRHCSKGAQPVPKAVTGCKESANLYCLVTEAHSCELLAEGHCALKLLFTSPTLYWLPHHTTPFCTTSATSAGSVSDVAQVCTCRSLVSRKRWENDSETIGVSCRRRRRFLFNFDLRERCVGLTHKTNINVHRCFESV